MADDISVNSNDDYVVINSEPKLKIAKDGDLDQLKMQMNEVLKDEEKINQNTERENPFIPRDGNVNSPPEPIVDKGSTIFNGITYLGAASINAPRSEPEINRNMEILNSQSQVSYSVTLAVPNDSDGTVRILDPTSNSEIASYRIHRITFCCRGPPDTLISNCFAFICSHGENEDNTMYRCHIFRCNLQEATGRILYNFSIAFQKIPNNITKQEFNSSLEMFNFNVTLEIKEDDGKGSFSVCPRDKNSFKFRSNLEKKLIINVTQTSNHELKVERCFGLLISPGRNVKNSDMHLIDMNKLDRRHSGGVIPHKMAVSDSKISIGSSSESKTYIISGQWDPTDPNFQILNTETHGDARVFLTVAVDLVISDIQEPVRFLIETKAKIYPTSERFWYLQKKPIQENFVLQLKRNNNEKGEPIYDIISIDSQTEINRKNNMSLKIHPNQIAIDAIQTPQEGPDEESDDDETILSGTGIVSKEITDDDLLSNWQQVLIKWNQNLKERPKQVTDLVRKGVPEALRGEIWQRLSNCHQNNEFLDAYRILITKDSISEQVILRDINRTFPAHDYFKEANSSGGQEALYRISKAYSVYDEEIGYCQGLSFLSAALLLHMPEEQAFCVLVQMMRGYGLREMYKPGFDALHVKFYQLERLIQDRISDLYRHFKDLGVEVHMFASQWFLSLFSAKFPLPMVFHIIDLILCDGLNMVFSIALALLKHSRKDLLALDFEGVLKYFRVNLPKNFRIEKNTRDLLTNAVSIKVNVKKLKKYETEYRTMKELERQTENPIDVLEREQHLLNIEVFRLENENDLLAQELVTSKISLRKQLDEAENHCEELKDQVEMLSKKYSETKEERDRLASELLQLKEIIRKETEKSTGELKRNTTIITDYKQIISQMSQRLDKQESLSNKQLKKLKNVIEECETCSKLLNSDNDLKKLQRSTSNNSCIGVEGDDDDTKTDTSSSVNNDLKDKTIRDLELELAQTKLALVESECRTQDLTHKLSNALNEVQSASKNTWLQKTITSIKDVAASRKESSSSVSASLKSNSNLQLSSPDVDYK